MGNSRMILYPDVNGLTNTVLEKTILVNNVNNVSLNITLVPDANATKFINIIDKTFILQPGEDKAAQFEVKVKKVGTYQGQINVFFRPAENVSKGGVVLSSTIIVIARKNQAAYTDNSTDNSDNTSGNDSGGTTSDNGSSKPGLSKLVIFWGISTIVLILVLLLLLYIWKKKRNKSKRKKNSYK